MNREFYFEQHVSNCNEQVNQTSKQPSLDADLPPFLAPMPGRPKRAAGKRAIIA
jgi:hypothetical protein